jgi:hypothetical protein
MFNSLRIRTVLGITVFLSASLRAEEPRPPHTDPQDQADAECVAALIQQLGSPRFDEREAATRALDALGPAALEPLRKALPSQDAEVRRRAVQLVRRIEGRLESIRALEPTRLRLVYREKPMSEALTEVASKTGLRFQLEGNLAKLIQRKITLDTGETTLWEALAEFCEAAGLSERGLRPGPGPDDRYRDSRIVSLREIYDVADRKESPLALKDGASPALPTHQAGALRVRALSPDTPLPGQTRVEGEALFGLEVRLEPRLQLQSVLALRIDRAIDEKGQTLSQPTDAVAGVSSIGTGNEILFYWDGTTELPSNLPSGAGLVPVRLRLPERPCRRLKELHATLALRALTPSEPLVTVDSVLRAAGQSFKGDDGSSLKVIEVLCENEGQVKLRVEVAPAPRDLVVDGLPARILLMNRGLRRGPVQTTFIPPVVCAEQLSLLDGRGRPIPLAERVPPELDGTGKAWEFNLVYRAGPGQGGPSRLVYTGRRSVTLEVPFTLKDVPLP